MSENLKDILSHLQGTTDQETLLKYLNNQLSEIQKHEVEKLLLQDSFDNEAMEGFLEIKNKEGIELMVDALNRDLKKKLEKQKLTRNKRTLKPQWAVYFSILILLIILVLVFIYIRFYAS
jgi:hypothetical protein